MATLNERFDPYLNAIGLTAERVGLGGVSYEGEFNGRTLKVHCSIRRRTRQTGESIRTNRYQGHQLEINLTTPIKTRLNFFEPDSAAKGLAARTNKWIGAEKLTDLGEGYGHLEVWGAEVAWVEGFLARPEVEGLVRTLIPEENGAVSIGLRLWPNNWTLTQRIHIDEITPEGVERWVTALGQLAELAERYPPSETVEASRWEKMSTERPGLTAGLIVGGLFLIFTVPALCCGLSFVLASFVN